MLLRHLLLHRWRHLLRGGSSGSRLFKSFVLGFFALYLGFSLAAIGAAFERVAGALFGAADPIALVDEYLLAAAFGYLGLRFFVQRPLKMDLEPYLHLPVPERPLVRFAQVVSLASLLNVFPLCFLGPFWLRSVTYDAAGWAGAFGWITGAVLLLLITHYANNWLRLLVADAPRYFVAAGLAVALVLGLDALLGGRVLGTASAALFGALRDGQLVWLLPLAAVQATLFAGSGRQLLRSLRHEGDDQAVFSFYDSRAVFTPQQSTTWNLMRLDAKLILRNRRPRSTIGVAAALGMLYAPFLLLAGSALSVATTAFASFFALIVGVSSYGQYLFSWDSEHFDGLMTRALPLRDLVRARLGMMFAFCAATFLVVLPFFLWLSPPFVLTLGAFLLYAMGVACPSIFFVALWNYKRVHLNRSGMFNYEGLSFQQFLVNVPVFLPPLACFLLFSQGYAALAVALLGAGGLALTPLWLRLFARRLGRRKYAMASGFRSYDG